SIRVLVDEALEDRHQDDPQVEPGRPVLHVVQVVLHAAGHLLDRIGFTAQAVHLGPAGDPGLDPVALHVAVHQGLVLLVVRDRVWPRADDGHRALQHVDELRQLVQAGAAQECPERRDPRVTLAGLGNGAFFFLMDPHAAELPHLDRLAAESVTQLAEEYRPWGTELYANGDGDHQGRDHQEDQGRQDLVHGGLDQMRRTIQGTRAQVEYRQTANLLDGMVQKLKAKEVREQLDVGRRVVQLSKDIGDLPLLSHRQGNPDLVD